MDEYTDGEVITVDGDGCLVLWDADRHEPYNCGETLEEFGYLTDTERERLVVWP